MYVKQTITITLTIDTIDPKKPLIISLIAVNDKGKVIAKSLNNFENFSIDAYLLDLIIWQGVDKNPNTIMDINEVRIKDPSRFNAFNVNTLPVTRNPGTQKETVRDTIAHAVSGVEKIYTYNLSFTARNIHPSLNVSRTIDPKIKVGNHTIKPD